MIGLFIKPIVVLAAALAVTTVQSAQAPTPKIYVSTLYPVQLLGFAQSANGPVVPQNRIAGPNTRLTDPVGIAVGLTGNIYAVNAGGYHEPKAPSITIFSPANGDARPVKVIRCGMREAWSAAVDGHANVHVTDPMSSAIWTFASGADGCVAPISSIRGSRTMLTSPTGIAYDGQGRTIAADLAGSINTYASGAKGDVAPIARIAGQHTRLFSPEGLALDSKNNVFATNYVDKSVTEYAAQSNGDATPIRLIRGDRTLMDAPIGIAVSKTTGQIFVASLGSHAILVFGRNANGNTPPVRVVRDAQGQLFPAGVALSESDLGR